MKINFSNPIRDAKTSDYIQLIEIRFSENDAERDRFTREMMGAYDETGTPNRKAVMRAIANVLDFMMAQEGVTRSVVVPRTLVSPHDFTRLRAEANARYGKKR